MSNNYRVAKRWNNGGSAGHNGSRPPASKVTASPVAGVDRLDYGHDNNFVVIRQQLADKLREDYGDLSSFIMSGVRNEPVVPTLASIEQKYPELTMVQCAGIYPSLILAHEKQARTDQDKYAKMYGTLCRVLSEELRDKVERAPNYVQANELSDPVILWEIIVATAGMHLDPGDGDDAGQTVKIQYQKRYQGAHESLLSFYNATQLLIRNMTLLDVPDAPTAATAARDFLSKMDSARYGTFYAALRRNVRIGTEEWPSSVLAAYEDVEASCPSVTAARGQEARTGPAVFNVNTGGPRERRNPPSAEVLAKNPCKGCGKFGHWLRECPDGDKKPKDKRTETVRGADKVLVNLQDEGDEDYTTSIFMTNVEKKAKRSEFGPDDVIYDSGGEEHVFRDRSFLRDSSTSDQVSTVGVTGKREWAQSGELPGFPGNALVIQKCPVGIFSGIIADDLYPVVYDQGRSYTVMVADDLHIRFDRRPSGFYACDFSKYADALRARFPPAPLVAVATVQSLEADYTKREIKGASAARELQRALGWPSRADLITALRAGTIIDCPVTVEDVVRAEAIWGESVAIAKGKTTDPGPTTPKDISVPRSTRKTQTMYSDILTVLGVPLIMSVLKPLNLLVATEVTTTRKAKQLALALLAQVNKARGNGFEVEKIFVDGETPLVAAGLIVSEHRLQMIQVGAGDHVVIIERAIRLVKERVRCLLVDLPWPLPKGWVRYLVYYVVTRINSLPRMSGTGLSAREEFRARKLSYLQDLTLCFGDYCQAYRAPAFKNSMEQRTVGAIALCPMDNLTRSWIFMNLITVRTFTSSKWKLLPTPDLVIDRVRQIATTGAVQPREDEGPPPLIDTRDLRDLPHERSHPLVDAEPLRDKLPRFSNPEYPDSDDDEDMPSSRSSSEYPDSDDEEEGEPRMRAERAADAAPNPVPDADDSRHSVSDDPVAAPNRRSTRVRAPRKVFVVSGNMSLTKALRLHGDVADNACRAELIQMVRKGVFRVLTPTEVKGRPIIQSHMFMKEKRDQKGDLIKVKARLVAGGDAMDKSVYTAEKRTSPTVHTESFFMLLALAASRGMKVASIDIESAFLECDMPPGVEVLMRLPKEVAAQLVAVEPEHEAKLNSNGCLVVLLQKALYGTVIASQLWYNRLSDGMLSFGLKQSLIDRCVFYGELKGHPVYICIHVDDIAVMHDNDAAVSELETLLNGIFTKANVDRSNPLAFIGMNITSGADGIYVDMTRYERECCESWGVTASLDTPGDVNLFTDDADSELLDTVKCKTYHTGAAKLLFLAKRARPDILTATSVCCSKVTKPTQQDWKRLERVFRYLFGTAGLGLLFKRKVELLIKCFGDASFASRVLDAKSRSGVICQVCDGVVATKSSWQTLTTLCTPEAELVTMCEAVVIALGCKNFYESIEVTVPPIQLMEDNKTTIDYANFGGPIHTRTRYIAVKYYFVKQHVDSGEVTIIYCPTREMLADLMTKPVTGALFVELRDGLLYQVPAALVRKVLFVTA